MSEATIGEAAPTRANVGCGTVEIPGYFNIDRKNEKEAYPLDVPDESLDELRASHVLEHFGHQHVAEVLRHWMTKLRPGGLLKLAVPDGERIARAYLAGEPDCDVQGLLMGGQTNENDSHGTMFDREMLQDLMARLGFERIQSWSGDNDDCSTHKYSLNLAARKPVSAAMPEGMHAIVSLPRFGPTAYSYCLFNALGGLVTKYRQFGGAFWHQGMCEGIEGEIERGAQYILTLDYDVIMRRQDVLDLYRILNSRSDIDCIAAMQMKRDDDKPLFSISDGEGGVRETIAASMLLRLAIPVQTAHFGCTLFRAEAFSRLPRPWMRDEPGKDGRWRGHRAGMANGDGKLDADISFWRNWETAGLKVCVSPQVCVGHVVERIVWPGKNLRPVYQSLEEWEASGRPER